jgi:hypothetical protein
MTSIFIVSLHIKCPVQLALDLSAGGAWELAGWRISRG